MIHPDTELKFINDEIGYGVFAVRDIKKGTIIYVKDMFDIEITFDDYAALSDSYKKVADKYSYIDENGVRIMSWDNAKYVNHRCECNTMSTGYGFEVAIRDIPAGEEITDEYGLFNIIMEMEVACGCTDCRGVVRFDDLDRHHKSWDERIRDALTHVTAVDQPLWRFLDQDTHYELMSYLNGHTEYKSVLSLKYEHKSLHKYR
jgi:hypothetical protein